MSSRTEKQKRSRPFIRNEVAIFSALMIECLFIWRYFRAFSKRALREFYSCSSSAFFDWRLRKAALTRPENRGWGRFGLDLNSG